MNIGDRLDSAIKLQNTLVEKYFVPYAAVYLRFAFAFVFCLYGLQKVAPTPTPVFNPIEHLVIQAPITIPATVVIGFIGTYEMFMGLLFAFKRLRLVMVFFFPHQITTQLVIWLNTDLFFVPPYITVGGIDIPWLIGTFAAFALKNTIFIGGFMLLCVYEYPVNE